MSSGRSDRPRNNQPKPRPRTGTGSSANRNTARSGSAGQKRTSGPGRPSAPKGRRGGAGRFFRGLAIFLLLIVLAIAVTGGVVWATMSKQLPDPDPAKARGRDQSTTILDRNGKLLAQLWAEENRQDIPLAKMPPHLRQAIVATEDKRFYEHEGVDPIGITRALVVDVLRGEMAQGGSTITQQYVKQAFVTSEKTLKRKVQEAILAGRIEQRYSKDEILESYLNTIYFGHGAYGVEAASRAYFGKSVTKVTLAEAALLAGVVKSPGRYSPYLDADAALTRRNTVLNLMGAQGYITESQQMESKASTLTLAGLKPRTTLAPYFVEWVKEQLIDTYGERRVYRGGLRVKTTIDMRSQRAAEQTIAKILDRKDDPSAALVAIKPGTGEVIAMVGGRDFTTQQFNVAVQGRRQPGSAFKTFVLASALSEGVSPEKTYAAGPIKIPVNDGTWSVTGASGAKGPMRLRVATEKSVNSVFAQLIMEIGPENVVEMAETLGVDSHIGAVPAIALGGLTKGVSPLEMAESYATLAAGGVHSEPFAISEVAGPDGTILESTEPKNKKVLDPDVAWLTTDLLRGVLTRGTGTAAGIGRPAAGKTGTTQQYRDAWFVGYTPDLATAVWVGHPASQREMKSVHGRRVTGGSFPAQIWASFMKRALEGVEKSSFPRPAGLISKTLCSETGGTITPYCPKTFKAWLLKRSVVTSCTAHVLPIEVVVPSLVGTSKDDALARLEALKLVSTVTEREIPGMTSGIVAEQSPAPGTKLKPGATVQLVVATGVTANQPPTAVFTLPPGVKAGKQATLDGSASTDDGAIVKYLWEFGDGATATGKSVSHVWATPGTYEIILWVTDDRGAQASATRRLSVR